MSYFFILLLRLVAYFEGSTKIVAFACVALLIGAYIVYNFALNRSSGAYLVRSLAFSLFILIIITLQTFLLSTITIRDIAVLITFLLWYIYVLSKFWQISISKALEFLFISFFIYNLVNYIIYQKYFSHEIIGMNSILTLLHINGYRISFPLSSGANINAAQIGLTTLIGAYLIKPFYLSYKKIIYLLFTLFQLMLLVLVDSRLILLITLSFSFLIYFSFNKIINFLKKYWLILSLSLIGFMYIFYATDFLASIKRPGEKSGAAINRFEIWTVSMDIIGEDIKWIVGHGLNGLENGVNKRSMHRFSEQKLQTTHNLIIQTLMDFGVIGLIITFYLINKIVKRSNRINNQILKLLIAATLILGTTEAIPTFYSFEATLCFLGIVAIINIHYERKIN